MIDESNYLDAHLKAEFEMDDAPAWYTSEQASAWAVGANYGHGDRDPEVIRLTAELTAARARYGDLEARLVEAEAVIAAALEVQTRWPGDDIRTVRAILRERPSTVLSTLKHEWQAEAWDRAVEHLEPAIEQWMKRAAHADNPYRQTSEGGAR